MGKITILHILGLCLNSQIFRHGKPVNHQYKTVLSKILKSYKIKKSYFVNKIIKLKMN